MLSAFLFLLKVKKFTSSILVMVGTATTVTSSKRGFKFFRTFFKIIAMFLVPVFLITFITPTASTYTDEANSTLIVDKEKQKTLLDAIKSGVATWEGSANNTSFSSASTTSLVGQIDTDYVMEYDKSKLSEKNLQQIRDYVAICTEIANAHKIEVSYIYALNIAEQGCYELGNGSGVYIPRNNMDEAINGKGYSYGDVHPVTNKTITYENYGKTETLADGVQDNRSFKGPFQINASYSSGEDFYNFRQAANYAAGCLLSSDGTSGSLLDTDEYFEGISLPTEVRGAIAITMHNTGVAGFYSRVPKESVDARGNFVTVLSKAANTQAGRETVLSAIKGFGSDDNFKSMFTAFDEAGAQITTEASSQYNITTKTKTFSEMSSVASNPGDIKGKYKGKIGGYTGDSYKLHTYNNENVIGYNDSNNFIWALDREAARYILIGCGSGKYLEATYNSVLSDNTTTTGGGGEYTYISPRVTYYWQNNIVTRNGSNIPSSPTEGMFNEVGYKGTFPIFIQGTSLNDVSKTPWHFSGIPTTIGASACSLYTLTSLIHGVGYGTSPIPIQTNGVDGLNEQGYICLQEMAKALPNGPVVADDASSLGYIIKTISTTDEGLEELYKDLKQGVPYAVNVRYGDITGYDSTYKPHTVHFTNEGHFLLMVGAYELGNKRYVEVVQSTYSNGGQATVDQNDLVFDFDELKSKQIIRSSSGGCVPAYTITGMRGSSKIPNYMKSDYIPPTRVETIRAYQYSPNTTEQTDISINSLISDIKESGYIKLPKELYVDKNDDHIDIYITETTFLRLINIKLSNMIVGSAKYKEGTFIGSVSSDTVYEHYANGVKVTL